MMRSAPPNDSQKNHTLFFRKHYRLIQNQTQIESSLFMLTCVLFDICVNQLLCNHISVLLLFLIAYLSQAPTRRFLLVISNDCIGSSILITFVVGSG